MALIEVVLRLQQVGIGWLGHVRVEASLLRHGAMFRIVRGCSEFAAIDVRHAQIEWLFT